MANIFSKIFGKKETNLNGNEKLNKDRSIEESEIPEEQDDLPEEEGEIEKVEIIQEEHKDETGETNEEHATNEEPGFVEKPKGFFTKLKDALTKTRQGLSDKIDSLLANFRKVDEDLFEELEEMLIMSDIGVITTQNIIENVKNTVKLRNISDPLKIKELLKEELMNILNDNSSELELKTSPSIVIIVGVNGVGKTTSIGKLANNLKQGGKKVLLAAGDTFRAAAIDQLEVWGKRVGVDVIKHQEGADPGAVVYDAIQAAKARKADVLICDTAGRLHNKKNLMDELGKVERIIQREIPDSSREVLLVLDATTGQNAVSQARTFNETTKLTGIILTKLDGTAKGGIIITIKSELNIPIKYIGVGEGIEDLQKFDSVDFVNALFED